jgi:hypothetical protein
MKTIQVPDPKHESLNLKWKAVKSILFFITFLCLAFILLQVFTLINNISGRWEEIKFAYEKPAIVKSIKKDYDTKQSKLDQSYVQPNKNPDQKIIDEVIAKIKEQESK